MARLLGSATGRRPMLRERFDAGEMVLAPGCYDALGARLIGEAAFPAAYMTGSCTSSGWDEIRELEARFVEG